MADQNKSKNNRPQNMSEVSTNYLPGGISRVLGKAGHESMRYQEDVLVIGETDPVYSQYQAHPEIINAPGVKETLERRRKAQARIDIYEESAARRNLSQIETNISQSFGSVNGIVQQNLRTTEYQHKGLATATRMSPMQVERRLARSDERLAGYESQIRDLKTITRYNEADPESVQQMNTLYGKVAQETKIRSRFEAAAKIHKAQGMDPQTTYEAIATSAGMAKEALTKDPSNVAAQKLVESFDKLVKVIDRTDEKFEELQNETLKLSKDFESSGGGGGSKLSRITNMAMPWLNAGAAAFGALGNATMQIGVNQRLGMAQNAAGFADFENQKYQTYKAAAGGDIASLMQMSQFGGAEQFGNNLNTNTNIALSEKTASSVFSGLGNILTGVAKGAAIGTLAEPGGGTIVGGILGGISAASSDVGNVAVGVEDINRNVTGGQVNISARQAQLDVARAINAVGAEQLQGFRDFSVGASTAAMGMGARGEDFLKEAITDKNLSRMANSRISPEQYNQMAAMGSAAMGSTFDQSMIFAARGAESRGLGSMQENMQRMAALSSAGANNPQQSYAGVLEVALAKGLDSSKALNAVAEHTATMAASTAGRALGLDTTAAAATLLMSGISKDTPNKEAALERAASLQDAARGIGTNIGVSYAGMVANARTQNTIGRGGVQAIAAETIDTETLMTISNMKTDKEKKDALINLGVNPTGSDINATLKGMINNRQMKMLEAGGTGFVTTKDRAKLIEDVNKAKSYEDLTEAERQQLGLTGRLSPMKATGKEMFDILKGVKSEIDPNAPHGKEATADVKADAKSLRSQLDQMRTLGFKQLTTAAQTAATNLGGAATAVQTLTTAFNNLEKAMPTIEKNATTAAGKAAAGEKGMDINVTKFNTTIDKLDTVLDRALSKSGLGTSSSGRQKSAAPGP